MFNFKGKTILVTGGAQGIGKDSAPVITDCDVKWNELIRLL